MATESPYDGSHCVCKICGDGYDPAEVSRNYGSDRSTCWPCLKKHREACEADPYKVGAGIMRNERPENVPDAVVEAYKRAFEKTAAMQNAETWRTLLLEVCRMFVRVEQVDPVTADQMCHRVAEIENQAKRNAP